MRTLITASLLLLALPALGSVAFDPTGAEEHVAVVDDSSWNDLSAFSFCMWAAFDSLANNDRLWRVVLDTGNAQVVVQFSDNDDLEFAIPRATTTAVADSNGAGLTTGVWYYICGTYDESDGPRLFIGSLTATAAEVTYGTRTVGTGATLTNTGGDSLGVGGRIGSTSANMDGSIHSFRWTASRLTASQVGARQFTASNESLAGDVILHVYHTAGLTHPDWSGTGNAGSETGTLTSTDPAPVP